MLNIYNKLPNYYKKSNIMKKLDELEYQEIIKINEFILNSLEQFFIVTATNSLDRYEKQLGLNINYTNSIEERRSVVLAKLKGQGTTTVQTIKNIAESFKHGEVDVIENYSDYSVLIKFINKTGTPKNIEELKRAIRNVLPAHLNLEFEYLYNKWLDFNADKWDEISNLTWGDMRVKSLSKK